MTMSNVTSQARQSVAKNLRYLARCYTPEGGLERFRATLEDELFTGAGHRNYTEVFARLAELIDPEERTCYMSEHSDLQPRGWYIRYWECSDCHAHYRDKDMPRFSPNCGARVVNDASDAEA